MITVHLAHTKFFNKFYLRNLFLAPLYPLEECNEELFYQIVYTHRSLFDLEYDGTTAQNYLLNGEIFARRERV